MVRAAYLLKDQNYHFFAVLLNKSLKYVFNIILEKSLKLFFAEKNGAQINGFAVVKKAPNLRKKIFSKEISFKLICTDKTFKMVCRNFLKVDGSRDGSW